MSISFILRAARLYHAQSEDTLSHSRIAQTILPLHSALAHATQSHIVIHRLSNIPAEARTSATATNRAGTLGGIPSSRALNVCPFFCHAERSEASLSLPHSISFPFRHSPQFSFSNHCAHLHCFTTLNLHRCVPMASPKDAISV